MNLTPDNATWLLSIFTAASDKLPTSGTFEPYYNATSWDFDDLMRAFRQDAVWTGDVAWHACERFLAKEKWPRMRVGPAFWLRERWIMAVSYCREILNDAGVAPNGGSPVRPKSPKAMVQLLVIDLWDEAFVDIWLQENARHYVRIDPYAGDYRHVEFERCMRKFEGTI